MANKKYDYDQVLYLNRVGRIKTKAGYRKGRHPLALRFFKKKPWWYRFFVCKPEVRWWEMSTVTLYTETEVEIITFNCRSIKNASLVLKAVMQLKKTSGEEPVMAQEVYHLADKFAEEGDSGMYRDKIVRWRAK